MPITAIVTSSAKSGAGTRGSSVLARVAVPPDVVRSSKESRWRKAEKPREATMKPARLTRLPMPDDLSTRAADDTSPETEAAAELARLRAELEQTREALASAERQLFELRD